MVTYAYTRVSGRRSFDNQTSLEEQHEKILAYCKAHDIPEPVFIGEDSNASGYDRTRNGFVELKSLIERGGVDTVIIYDLSRLSRNLRDTLEFVEDYINKHDIKFISLKQNIDTSTAIGKAFLAISATFNQLVRDEFAEKMQAVRQYQRNNNIFGGGLVPYGYKLKDATLSEDENEQTAILLMKDLRKQGMSLKAICKYLIAKQIPTRTGSSWHPEVVRRILNAA